MKHQIIAYAKGAILKIAAKQNHRNTLFSIISLFNGEATICLKESSIKSQIEQTLEEIKTGGKTNLVAGFQCVKRISSEVDKVHILHVLTDGKVNTGGNLEESILAYQTLCKGIHKVNMIDTEQGIIKMNLVKGFAERIKADYQPLITEHA